MKSKLIRFTIVAAVLASMTASIFAASLAEFEERYLTGNSTPYRLYIPDNYDPAKTYPVISYFASSGQTSAASTVQHPNVTDCLNWAKDPDHEAFVYVPYRHSTTEMIATMDELSAEFNIDRTRVYTTGWSMGGGRSFTAVALAPTEFAAAAPMAARADQPGTSYVGRPIWAFNGTLDFTRPPSGVVPKLEVAWQTDPNILYTEVIGGDHSSTPRTGYAEPGLFPWMFAQATTKATDVSMFVGWAEDATETINLIGPAQSMTRTGEYFVGYYGNGQLNINRGATLDTKHGYVAVDGDSDSSVYVSGTGSQWNIDGKLHLGYRGGAEATVTVGPGGEVNVSDQLLVIPGSELALEGGHIHANSMYLDGTLTVDFEKITQPGAGHLEIDGFARMNGLLNVILPENISTIVGKSATIATFASHADDMRGLAFTELGDDLILAPTLSPTELSITITYLGDANLDGQVGLLDLDILGQNYGQFCDGGITCGDFSNNGSVTLLDLDILGDNWGLGTAVTPEPASIGAFLIAAIAITRRR